LPPATHFDDDFKVKFDKPANQCRFFLISPCPKPKTHLHRRIIFFLQPFYSTIINEDKLFRDRKTRPIIDTDISNGQKIANHLEGSVFQMGGGCIFLGGRDLLFNLLSLPGNWYQIRLILFLFEKYPNLGR